MLKSQSLWLKNDPLSLVGKAGNCAMGKRGGALLVCSIVDFSYQSICITYLLFNCQSTL